MNFFVMSRSISRRFVSSYQSTLNKQNQEFESLSKQESLHHVLNLESDKDEPVTMPNPFMKEKKKCLLCQYNITPDYKNIRFLSQFQSKFTGIVYGRHITGLCKHKQEMLEREIKKAQNAGLMGTYCKDINYHDDTKLYDIENPFRPHKY